MLSLLKREHNLSDPANQIELLESSEYSSGLPAFDQVIQRNGLTSLKAGKTEVLQVNVGKLCNQTCKHCHVDAGPDRREVMTKEILNECLRVVRESVIPVVDITGGAPELNPHFRWFVEQLSMLDVHVISRCNLTVINSNKRYADLPQFYARHRVEVVSSLPYFTALRTDSQRGQGVFESSILALRKLNEAGYGNPETGLELNLVYNPAGAFLPPDQTDLEVQFRKELDSRYGIRFNNLYCITNLPVSRFLEYLFNSGNYHAYMEKLIIAFNPAAMENVMCRNMVSVGWDGSLYDCDFNQMLEIGIGKKGKEHIKDFIPGKYDNRVIRTGRHCFGCTAGAGSSCGGTIA
jgi:radical SAM/Cys-rich protein